VLAGRVGAASILRAGRDGFCVLDMACS